MEALRRRLARLAANATGGVGPPAGALEHHTPPAAEDPSSTLASRGDGLDELRARVTSIIARDRARLREQRRSCPPGPPVSLPGRAHVTEFGELWCVDRDYDPEHCHGSIRVSDALRARASTIARLSLDGDLAEVDPSGWLFLDTETTGLAGGAGTLPFLVGLGWFEGESLHLEQLLLTEPGREVPILQRLASRLRAATCLVTYNGKAYDWPLLRTRFIINRIVVDPPRRHLDLLHCARRIYKRRLGRVRLVDLEARVLRMHREHDIDGSEIPQRYWDFVRDADGRGLAKVLEHNENDIVALAAILTSLVRAYDGEDQADAPEDRVSTAIVAARAADCERAAALAWSAAHGGGDAGVTFDAMWLWADLMRKRGDFCAQLRALLSLLDGNLCEGRRARVHLALAKLYEHRVKDPHAALTHAEQAGAAESPDVHERRLTRLRRRIEKMDRNVDLAFDTLGVAS